MYLIVRCLFIFLLTISCEKTPDSKPNWEEIGGRDEADLSGALIRYPVYRAKVPKKWLRKDPAPFESNFDSTKPLCEFFLDAIRITVHNFPNEKIPPFAQIERWKRQLQPYLPESISILPESQGGFFGFQLEGEGIFKKNPVKMFAWAMQMDPELSQNLETQTNSPLGSYYKQMKASYTIKAVGPPEQMEAHKEEIVLFARSFELIQEIPYE